MHRKQLPYTDQNVHPAYERRFHTEDTFLADQLKHHRAIQDFKSVQGFLSTSKTLFLEAPFQFHGAASQGLQHVTIAVQHSG